MDFFTKYQQKIKHFLMIPLVIGVGYKTFFFQIQLATSSLHVKWCQGKGTKKIFEKFLFFRLRRPKN